jgi:predicted metalloprotease
MKWQLGRRSTNVEDRRGMGIGGPGIRLGCGGIILIGIIALITGQNPLELLTLLTGGGGGTQVNVPSQQAPARPGSQGYDQESDFVSAILADTEDTWSEVFSEMNRSYEPPTLVLFTEGVQSACGISSAAVGPFYCPLDSKVYLDLTFFRELDQRFGASGDFAQAYVIAHEVGHHVQNLMGISDKVRSLQERSSQEDVNALSVRLELQADCFAGVWGNHADQQRHVLESGDLEEALNAAAAVGDDRIQQSAGRAVSPESWTHGSAQQRASWFRRGFQSGDVNSCDTFKQ